MKIKIILTSVIISLLFFECKSHINTSSSGETKEKTFSEKVEENDTSQIQKSIIGMISNYTNGAGLITSYDMISGEKIILGNIDQKGKFNLPLDENFLNTLSEKAKIAQEKAPSGWKIEFNTIAKTFGCDGNELVYQNGEAIVTGIPDPNITDKEGNKVVGVLYAVSQPEIAKWLYSYGQDNAVKGYYLQWYFVENQSSVKGKCEIPTYTGIGNENYDHVTVTNLEFQKGWNLLKYNILEVFKDANGKTTPSKIEINRIAAIPQDVQWYAVTVE